MQLPIIIYVYTDHLEVWTPVVSKYCSSFIKLSNGICDICFSELGNAISVKFGKVSIKGDQILNCDMFICCNKSMSLSGKSKLLLAPYEELRDMYALDALQEAGIFNKLTGGFMILVSLSPIWQTIENFNSVRDATAHIEPNKLIPKGSLVFRVTTLLQNFAAAS